jgi:hypothetical protein
MTAARRFTDEERAELAEIMREAIRAELGAERPKPVDAPKPAAEHAASNEPTLDDYIKLRQRRRRRGIRG